MKTTGEGIVEKLKPCPFCGAPAELHEHLPDNPKTHSSSWYVGCTKCTATVEWDSRPGIAAETWNRRIDEALLTALATAEGEVERLRACLKQIAEYKPGENNGNPFDLAILRGYARESLAKKEG